MHQDWIRIHPTTPLFPTKSHQPTHSHVWKKCTKCIWWSSGTTTTTTINWISVSFNTIYNCCWSIQLWIKDPISTSSWFWIILIQWYYSSAAAAPTSTTSKRPPNNSSTTASSTIFPNLFLKQSKKIDNICDTLEIRKFIGEVFDTTHSNFLQ